MSSPGSESKKWQKNGAARRVNLLKKIKNDSEHLYSVNDSCPIEKYYGAMEKVSFLFICEHISNSQGNIICSACLVVYVIICPKKEPISLHISFTLLMQCILVFQL